ncbi:MAG TPA: hypothetical protein VGE54_04595, partial [Brevundimonas sp.]
MRKTMVLMATAAFGLALAGGANAQVLGGSLGGNVGGAGNIGGGMGPVGGQLGGAGSIGGNLGGSVDGTPIRDRAFAATSRAE